MIDFLLNATLSNLVTALPLAAMAYGVQTLLRRPALAHLLWVLVLLKFLTPPLLTLHVSVPQTILTLARKIGEELGGDVLFSRERSETVNGDSGRRFRMEIR